MSAIKRVLRSAGKSWGGVLPASAMTPTEDEAEVIVLSDSEAPTPKKKAKKAGGLTAHSGAGIMMDLTEGADSLKLPPLPRLPEVEWIDDDDEVMVVEEPGKPKASGSKIASQARDLQLYEDVSLMGLPEYCAVCCSDDGLISLAICRHGVCISCLKSAFKDEPVPPVSVGKCPVEKCARPLLSANDMMHLLKPADFDKYAKQQLQAFQQRLVDHEADRLTCPKCGAPCSESKKGKGSRKRAASSASSSSRSRKRSESSSTAEVDLKVETAPLPPPKSCFDCDTVFCALCGLDCSAASSKHERLCARLYVYRLFLLSRKTLAMLDAAKAGNKGKHKSSKKTSTTKWGVGVGFGGVAGYGQSGPCKAEQEAAQKQQEQDETWRAMLVRWKAMMPPERSPLLPETHTLLFGAFRDSAHTSTPLARLLCLLFRNDSFLDLTTRRELYIAALDLLSLLARHPLVGLGLTKTVDMDDEDDEEEEKKGKGDGAAGATKPSAAALSSSRSSFGGGKGPMVVEGDQGSLLSLLERLAGVAKFFQQCGGKQQTQITQDEEAKFVKDMGLALRVIEVHKDVKERLITAAQEYRLEFEAWRSNHGKLGCEHDVDDSAAAAASSSSSALSPPASSSKAGSSRSGSGSGRKRGRWGACRGGNSKEEEERAKEEQKATAAAKQHAYIEAMGPLRFDSASVLDARDGYAFKSDAQAAASGATQKGSLVRVMQEIASLGTTLPVEYASSVFVRADEERPDVLKALISGPEGTPYSNGLFTFDIFLPPSYPNVPPKVKLCTTGGGRVRFNPNLYACGKVCLSLLGTWSGPGWGPESTLLQVLVSIQSLIMVQDPYFNEPGYERHMGTVQGNQQSAAYNRGVRQGNVLYAMTEQLRHPPSAFADVVKQHFRLKKDDILKEVNEWVAESKTALNASQWNRYGTANTTNMSGGGTELERAAQDLASELAKL